MLEASNGLTIGGFIATLVALFLAVIAYFISRRPSSSGRRPPPDTNGSQGRDRPQAPSTQDDPYKWE